MHTFHVILNGRFEISTSLIYVNFRWLAEVESLVASGMEPKSELMEKKAQLERFKTLQQDLESHRSSMGQLEHYVGNLEKYAPENAIPRDTYSDLDQRYKAAMSQIQVWN